MGEVAKMEKKGRREEIFVLVRNSPKVYLIEKCEQIVPAAFSSKKGHKRREKFVLVGKRSQGFYLTVKVSRKQVL